IARLLPYIVALAIIAVYCLDLMHDRAASAARMTGQIAMLAERLATAGLAFAPLALPACWGLVIGMKRQPVAVIALAVGFVASICVNAAFQMGGRNEYKFMYCAAIMLAPLTALGLDALVRKLGTKRWIAALGCAALLAPWMLSTAAAAARSAPTHG